MAERRPYLPPPMEEAVRRNEPRRLGDFLRDRHGDIMARWEREVSRLRPARFLARPALLDHMPDFLRQLSDYVSAWRDGYDATPPQQYPIVHAIERLDVGYDLDEVVAEYAVLRECITTLAYTEASPSLLSAQLPRLHRAIDLAIGASVERYSRTRERTFKALDRISTAALGVRDIETFLPRTLEVLLETTPAIDAASILLIENGRLRVKASAGLAMRPESAPSVGCGECLAGAVWEAQKPQTVRDAQSDPRVTCDVIQRVGMRAMYGVPLHFGTDLIGVAVMGSSSTFEFSHDDLLLFRAAVNRVAALVAHARLAEAVGRQNAMQQSILSAQGDLDEGFAIVEDGRVTVVNDALCRMLGRSADEIKALPSILALIVPERREAVGEILAQRFLGDRAKPGRVEATFLHKAGHQVEVDLGVEPKPTGRTVMIVRDVTQWKVLERERAEQRARLEAVLRILPVGVVIAEAPSGKAILGNEEATRMWGLRAVAQSIGEYGQFEGYWPDGRRVKPEEWPLARAVSVGETTPAEEIHIVGAEGVKRIVEHKAAPVRDATGAVVAGVVTLVDVTDRKRNEEELHAALAFRGQILNILAHDLQQPLLVLGTSAELLLRKGDLKEHTSTVQLQVRAVQRMNRLIRDLLDYARAGRGSGIPLKRKPTDLHAIVVQAVEAIGVVQSDRRVTLDRRGDCTGLFDPDRMLQVFGNLLDNAVTYSPKDTPIDVVLEDGGDSVVCRVHNVGEPIPRESLATIFEPFRRGTNGANPKGLGLGLFIVQQIVFAHRGTVGVASGDPGGTTFELMLPKS